MPKLLEELKQSLNEANEFLDGDKTKGRRTIYIVEPVKKYNSDSIKMIRYKCNFSQARFADYLGISVKTVEAWESGRNVPNGPSSRLLSMLEEDPGLIEKFPFVIVR